MSLLKMKPNSVVSIVSTLVLIFLISTSRSSATLSPADSSFDRFLSCLVQSPYNQSISKAIFTPSNSSFLSIYEAYANNLRFWTPETPKPLAIITALEESHVQATVICGKKHHIQIRIRSGGHDYEGLSYISFVPFVILDMFNLRAINVDIASKTAWVQAGATTGELYFRIAEKSGVHAFPAGVCTTLGTGGHFSGGGYGTLIRKYGLSIDNIVDARIVNVNGRILDRKSMGEDLFWAIRGGGGASFGVILSWKINLVRVPPKVTVFSVVRTLKQGATDTVYKWQQVASKFDKDLFIRIMPQVVNGSEGQKTVNVAFIGHFLGQTDRLLKLLSKDFPELGLQRNDCIEMSWVESTLFWFGFPTGTSIDVLLQRVVTNKSISKNKSDFARKIISKKDLNIIWDLMTKIEGFWMQWNPYGGRMEEIEESETAYPHRAGVIFKIQHSVSWTEEGNQATPKYLSLIRSFYNAIAPYVTSKPREAFLNYRDLDIGSSSSNGTNFEAGKVYGLKYFKGNYKKLAMVKAMVDPENFFKDEQSIPPLK